MTQDNDIKRMMLEGRPEPGAEFVNSMRVKLANLPERKKAHRHGALPISAVVFVAAAAICIVIINNNAVGGMFANIFPPTTARFAAGGATATPGRETAPNDTPAPAGTPAGGTTADATLPANASAGPVKTAIPAGLAAIGECETAVHNSSNEYKTNLALACSQLDGLMISPGQKLSFLDAALVSDQNTGYRSTPVLNPSNPEPPLGIRQVASTLYDAALLAGLDVAEWHHGTLAAVYAKKGLEADVNPYGKVDLVIVNNRDHPIWIKATLDAEYQKVAVSFYGDAWKGKRPRELDSTVAATQPAPDQTILVEDPNVTKGDVVTVPARPGYRVTVTRRWLDPDTNETSEETLYTAVYPPLPGELHYHPGEKPEPTP